MRPFVQFLEDAGAAVETGFQRAGLPFCALEHLNDYVPSHRFWAFIVDMAQKEDIPDLGFRVGQMFGANCADPHLTHLLRRSPTLYQGLLRASKLINETISHCRVGLIQPPRSQHIYFFHSPSCNARNPAVEQIGWFGITTLLGMVREFVDPRWQPTEIGVMTDHTPCPYIREQFSGTRIWLSQPYSYIALENALLSLPPLGHEAATIASSPLRYEPVSNDFLGSFKQVLHTYVGEHNLRIELAAALCDTSKRSRQRKLAKVGSCYAEMLDEVRFHTACQMMENPDMNVTDVAHRLGYSNPTHFSRAFRRIAGVTPQVYRKACAH